MPNQTPTVRDFMTSWRWSILLVLISLAAFVPALSAGFVLWDDPANFTFNPFFGGLSLAGLRWAWTAYQIGVYQPLAWMLLEAQYSLWGLHPTGYHVASLTMHAVNAVVLFVLVKTLLRLASTDGWVNDSDKLTMNLASVFAVALFAAHPLRVEVVAWISCQPYLPAVLFAMMAALTYLHAHPADAPIHRRRVIAAWLFVVAAMLCKAVAVTLPVLLIILDVYPLRRIGPGRWLDRQVWGEKLAFFVPALVFIGIAVRAKQYDEVIVPVSMYGVDSRLAQAFYGAGFYLIKTVWPVRLSAFYAFPEQMGLLQWPFTIAALSALAISVAAILLRRRWPGFLAAWLAYLVILGPNLGLVRIGSQIAADRYAYMASIPLTVTAAWLISRLFRTVRPYRLMRDGTAIGAVACLVLLGVRSWEQCRTWQTSRALWTNASILDDGRSLPIRVSLAEVLMEEGQVEKGVAIYREVLRLSPGNALAHYNLGVYSVWHNRFDEAEGHFRAALPGTPRSSPGLADIHYNLGCVLEQKDRLGEAITEYQEALRFNPRDPTIHNNLGAARLRQGQYREAEACFEEALRLNPKYDLARRGRDFARQAQGPRP